MTRICGWNNHAYAERLRHIVNRANVACPDSSQGAAVVGVPRPAWALGMDAVSFGISALIVLSRVKPAWFAAGLAGLVGRTVGSNAR